MKELHPFEKVLQDRFGGVLYVGKHTPDSQACVLEVASIVRGKAWSDDPRAVGLPDLRSLNDAHWSSDQARTDALIPVVISLWDWPRWSQKNKTTWARRIAKRTIQEIIPPMLRQVKLNTEADRCEKEGTEEAAEAAVWAARAAVWAARAAAWAAEAAKAAVWAAEAAEAAKAAVWAAEAAAWAARAAVSQKEMDQVLQLACRIWIEEAQRK